MKELYKTTAVIWTDFDPFGPECDLHMFDDGLERLAKVIKQRRRVTR